MNPPAVQSQPIEALAATIGHRQLVSLIFHCQLLPLLLPLETGCYSHCWDPARKILSHSGFFGHRVGLGHLIGWAGSHDPWLGISPVSAREIGRVKAWLLTSKERWSFCLIILRDWYRQELPKYGKEFQMPNDRRSDKSLLHKFSYLCRSRHYHDTPPPPTVLQPRKLRVI